MTKYTLLILMFFAVSCIENKDDDVVVVNKPNVENISKFNELKSHHIAENCMNCHYPQGDGIGHFSVAGTIFDSTKLVPYPNCIIRLYSKNNFQGNIIAEIEVDGKGNFFTTDTIDFTQKLYPAVFSPAGDSARMGDFVSNGQCSKCHGVSVNNIHVK